MRTLILAALVAVPLFSSCAGAVIGVGAGLIASQEMLDNSNFISNINMDVKQVWPVVKSYLSKSSPDVIEIDEELRIAQARVDGSLVTISVEAYGENRSVIRVAASRYAVSDGEMAGMVVDQLHQELGI